MQMPEQQLFLAGRRLAIRLKREASQGRRSGMPKGQSMSTHTQSIRETSHTQNQKRKTNQASQDPEKQIGQEPKMLKMESETEMENPKGP